MTGDARAETSFLQSHAEMDHRDRKHHYHRHHKHLHRRQLDYSVITQVTSTISVIQEIVIDQDGSTVGIQTWLAASTTARAPDDPTLPSTVAAIVLTSSAPFAESTSSNAAELPSTQPSQSLPSTLAPSLPSTPFLGSNSSKIGPASSSSLCTTTSSSNPSNYTASTTSLPPFVGSVVSQTSLVGLTSSSLFPSLTISSYSSSNSPSPTSTEGAGPGFGSGAGATGASSPSSTAGSVASGNSSDAGPSTATPAVVGGVVGGIAGIVFIVALLMVFVRWRKRKQGVLPLGSGEGPSTQAAPMGDGGGGGGPSQSGQMVERSLGSAIPAAFASLTGFKRASQQPSIGASSTAGSEQGFYRISGRKLPSVFQYGGDGYGGGHESLSGSSFYRDSRGFYGGPASPTSPLAGRDSGVPVTRPSPARTPVISEGAFAPPVLPSMDSPPQRPDALGRSHPSYDGSHGSRFTEEV